MNHHRLDIRIPEDLYNRIKEIAIATNQPPAPRTGEPSLAPIVITLLQFGLEAFEKENKEHEMFTPREIKLKNHILEEVENLLVSYRGNDISEV